MNPALFNNNLNNLKKGGVKCSLCGLEFDEKDAQIACSGCAIAKACSLMKCPNCGYELLPEPKLIKKIKEWRKREK
jgi:DNA-directed RNA polymerase subunit RPC12/RpoP